MCYAMYQNFLYHWSAISEMVKLWGCKRYIFWDDKLFQWMLLRDHPIFSYFLSSSKTHVPVWNALEDDNFFSPESHHISHFLNEHSQREGRGVAAQRGLEEIALGILAASYPYPVQFIKTVCTVICLHQ